MSFRDTLTIYSQIYQCPLEQEPPAQCLALINKARQEGLPLREVFVLSQPLFPLAGGGCNPETGEVWVLLRNGQEDGIEQTLRSLLHELAHLLSPPSLPYQGIDEDWNEERRTWERAYMLAREWGMEHLFPEAVLTKELEDIEGLREDHWAAGLLAGSTDPRLARRAYHGLTMLRSSQRWSLEQFSQALQGCSDDPFDNTVVIDFDRTVLRSSWRLPWSQGGSLGPCFTLRQTDESSRFLRDTLERIALMNMPEPPRWRKMHDHQVCFFEIDDSQTFTTALFWTQRLLLFDDAAHPMSARAQWWLYAEESPKRSPHLYRLSVEYSPAFGAPRGTCRWRDDAEPAPDVEVWFLFPALRQIRYLETAWQRYLLSWLRAQELRREPLSEDLPLLWSWLK